MSNIDKRSLALGAYSVGFLWTALDLIRVEDRRSFSFVADLVFAVAFGVLAVWTAKQIHADTASSGNRAHIDTEGVYAALRCTKCGDHIVYIEHQHDVARLASERDGHVCPADAEQKGGRS